RKLHALVNAYLDYLLKFTIKKDAFVFSFGSSTSKVRIDNVTAKDHFMKFSVTVTRSDKLFEDLVESNNPVNSAKPRQVFEDSAVITANDLALVDSLPPPKIATTRLVEALGISDDEMIAQVESLQFFKGGQKSSNAD